MAARIYPKRWPRLFLTEWREKKNLTQKQLGERLGVSDVTVSRWEAGCEPPGKIKNKDARRPDLPTLLAICEALGIEMGQLLRHPDQLSADDLLRGQEPDMIENTFKYIYAFRR